MTLPPSYFDDLYAGNGDPWGFADRWYEERKRALTLALLPERRYRHAFEPGCSIGVLTRELARRCDRVTATDPASAAVRAARRRCADLPGVAVQQGAVPADWPGESADLVVLSELGYYLSDADLAATAELAARAETVVAVHWRHPVADYVRPGDEVHAALVAASGPAIATYRDDDVVAQVWSTDRRSVATRDGLR